MKQEEAWKRGKFHAEYQRYRQGCAVLNPDLLVYLRRKKWASIRAQIGKEVAEEMPLVLIPPIGQRESDHETRTMYDGNRTVSGASN